MAKTSGANRTIKKTGGLAPGDWKISMTEIENIRSISQIKNNDVYREIKQGISRFHSELGVREQSVKLADMPGNINGAQATNLVTGENRGIYLNAKVFNKTKAEIIERTLNAYKVTDKRTGIPWSTRTNKPIQHTITHELAHALWNPTHNTAKAKGAGKEIRALYSVWMKDKKYRIRKKYGEYGITSVAEFFAETVTKHVHGNSDKYTNKIYKIIKKYDL